MKNNQIFPEIQDKGVFQLEHRVDVAEDIKQEESELKVRIDQGMRERKEDVLDFAKGVLGSCDM